MSYPVKLRTKNHSANGLKNLLKTIRTTKPFVVRLGSRTPIEIIFPKSHAKAIEINTVQSIENSRNKLLMKDCFKELEVSQSNWWKGPHIDIEFSEPRFPLLVKKIYGFKGKGMVKLDNEEQYHEYANSTYINDCYFEEYKNFGKEYRIHATQDEVFLSWRKMRKLEAEEKWFFNSTNCNWISEDNELFEKPEIWDLMCQHAIKAIKSTGLNIGAVDVRCKMNPKNESDFIVCEVNSAPELGEVGTIKYFEILIKIIKNHDSN